MSTATADTVDNLAIGSPLHNPANDAPIINTLSDDALTKDQPDAKQNANIGFQSSHPPWLKIRVAPKDTVETTSLLRSLQLTTICEEGLCPNRHECFRHGVATFMLLGKRCTRNCHYCHVEPGRPFTPDSAEPHRVAQAVQRLRLRYVVITSVTRDDLPDQGAGAFEQTVREIRTLNHNCSIELLVPDFKGKEELLTRIANLNVEVLSHNIEAVRDVFSQVRPQGNYEISLSVLKHFKVLNPHQKTKSGLMLGLGETESQIRATLQDLRQSQCDFLTLGQYLQPTEKHWKVHKYYSPEEFAYWKQEALHLGFEHVESGPLVRSSYRADKLQAHLTKKEGAPP